MSFRGLADFLLHPATISLAVHLALVIGLCVRVIMRRRPTGVTMSWLLLIAGIPYLGGLAYLLIGERRIGRSRAAGLLDLRKAFRTHSAGLLAPGVLPVDVSSDRSPIASISRMGERLTGCPLVGGSRLELFRDTEGILTRIARDIDGAQASVAMEFYIWNAGGRGDEVLEALIRAAERGVRCQVLVDALGARTWWKGDQPARLRGAGVELVEALPVGLFRTVVGRTDLRLHRKIVVIDRAVAWTGSMNLVDPKFFKQDAGVGQWIDAMVRVEGVAIAPLLTVLMGDLSLETAQPLAELLDPYGLPKIAPRGDAKLQVIPSGPGQNGDALLQMIVASVHAAQEQLVLTTPYLIPDESLLAALRAAAARGVDVDLIVPEKVDSLLTRHACRSYFDELLEAGVRIRLFRGGLLHTKSIRIDHDLAIFGTVNLDMRSFWLNYEVALVINDRDFVAALRDLHESYLRQCDELDRVAWSSRGVGSRLVQNTLRLASPLL